MNYCYTNFRKILFFVAVLFAQINAQPTNPDKIGTGLKFDHIGLEQGLSQSTVYAIVQDKQGFMWFGTQDGLNRYDGNAFKVFRHNPEDTNSIGENGIWSLSCSNDGDLWISSMTGAVYRYSVSKNKFYNYNNIDNYKNTGFENYLATIFEDSRGNIWLGTHSNGLNLYDISTDTFRRIKFDRTENNNLADYSIRAICEDRSGYLWIGTDKGLFKLKVEGNSINPDSTLKYQNSSSEPASLSENDIRSLYVDSKGSLWIGTSGPGLNFFLEKTNTFKRYFQETGVGKTTSNDFITSICEDAEGRLWATSFGKKLYIYHRFEDSLISFSTDLVMTLYKDQSELLWLGTISNGVMMYDNRKNKFLHYFDDPNNPNDLNGNLVSAIFEDQSGELWVGTYGNGLNRFDSDRNKVISYYNDPKDNNSISNDFIRAICESSDGNIWVGTRNGLCHFNKKTKSFIRYKHNPANSNSISSNSITTLNYDIQKNILWIGYVTGEVDCFDIIKNTFTNVISSEEFSNSAVSIIYRDKYSGLWIGADGGRVINITSYSNSGTKIHSPERYRLSKTTIKILNRIAILSIYVDNEDSVWIGTNGGGLILYTTKDNSIIYYKEEHGLTNNIIYGILHDNKGNLWLSTNKGISKFNLQTRTFRNYLQENEFVEGAYFRSSKGELFFGGVNGFNSFFPDEIKDNVYIPPVYLTNFKVFNEILPMPNPIPTDSEIELSYSQNFFSFEFVALNYTAPEKNQYVYKLEGFDKDWYFVPASQRYASYTNLDPGEYILKIKGSNNDGIWNDEGTKITLIIHPPFWMTWWFRFSMVVILAGIFYSIYRNRVNHLKKMERMRLRIASDLHDELGSDLSAMALASSMTKGVDENDNKRLNKIRENSLHIIEVMREIIWFIKPEHDNPDKLKYRMKETADSILEGIHYKVSISNNALASLPGLDTRQNLFLIYKECLTNIVKHAKCTTVDIEIVQNGNNFLMRIADNGKGFDTKKVNPGNGLSNIRVRTERIKASLEIKSTENEGTIIQLIRKNDADTSLKIKPRLSIFRGRNSSPPFS